MSTTEHRTTGSTMSWRNWNLPVKLAAVTLIPVLFAVVLGVLSIRQHVAEARDYSAVSDRIALNDQVDKTVAALQTERNTAAAARPGSTPSDAQRKAADDAVATLRSEAAKQSSLDGATQEQWRGVSGQLDRLPAVRGQWSAGADTAVTGYSDIVNSLLGFEGALSSTMRDPQLVSDSVALANVRAARDEVLVQQSFILAGIQQGKLQAGEASRVRDSAARLAARLYQYNASASQADRNLLSTKAPYGDANKRITLLNNALNSAPPSGNGKIGVSAADWNKASAAVGDGLGAAADQLAGNLRTSAADLKDKANTDAAITAGVLALVLVLAAAVVVIVARQLLRSIRVLHRSAQDVARRTLPDTVANIRAGRPVSQAIEPVPVRTNDEVGQLARAFDAVHAEARSLAVEQVGIRTNYGNMFVNLSRRSQTLVQRQLRLIEQLERDEEDPDQLGTLFQLDHLATRMRRNNENLMVLSGSEPHRGPSQQPVPLGDLLRASVSEIEQYQRVLLQPPPQATVLGYTSGDLVRLVAELLDNATAFSAPDTTVTVSTVQQSDNTVVISIRDHGIGMRAEELAQANERLAASASDEVPVSRRMGLFVVGRLAQRHGATVQLSTPTGEPGLLATVRIPRQLLAAIEVPDSGLDLDFGDRGTRDRDQTLETLLPQPAQPYGAPRRRTPESNTGAAENTSGERNGKRGAAAAAAALGAGAAATQVPSLRKPADDRGSDERDAENLGSDEHEPTGRDAAAGDDANATVDPQQASTEDTADSADSQSAPASTEESAEPAAAGSAETAASDRSERANTDASDADPSADGAQEQGKDGQRTPIFDSMLSVWFADPSHATFVHDDQRVEEPWKVDAGEAEASKQRADDAALVRATDTQRWRFAADDGWHAVEEVAEVEQDDFTEAGLPKRTRGARLLPGRAAAERAPDPALDHRDAELVRSRFASFQRGVSHGRAGGTPAGASASSSQDSPELFDSVVPEPDTAERWSFDADAGLAASAAAANVRPESLTSAGLPQRTPKARLVPGSVPGARNGHDVPQRDATQVRSRLSNFQRGVTQGRHNVGIPTQESADNADQWEDE